MSNIGHARTNKYFIDLVTLNLREVLHIIWIIGAGQDWFFDLVEVDLNDLSIIGIRIGLE